MTDDLRHACILCGATIRPGDQHDTTHHPRLAAAIETADTLANRGIANHPEPDPDIGHTCPRGCGQWYPTAAAMNRHLLSVAHGGPGMYRLYKRRQRP